MDSRTTVLRPFLTLALLAACFSTLVFAAAPSTQQDPYTNISSVYAFVGTKFNDSTVPVLNVIVDFHPLTIPCDPFAYARFSDDVRYVINIANPATGAMILNYNFRFTPVSSAAGKYKSKSTLFSYGRGTTIGAIQHTGDSNQNFLQQYLVRKIVVSPASNVQIGAAIDVPPPNVGLRVTPAYNDSNGVPISGATTNAGLDTYTRETINALASGEVVWAGERDDSLFGDFGGIGDLLDPRILGPDGHGQTGTGIDTRAGQNVLTIAMQIPLSLLPQIQYNDAFTGVSHGVGVYVTTQRQQTLTRSTTGDPVPSGSWIQVARMGNPFFDDFFVAIQNQDNYQRDVPTNDSAKYKKYATTPEFVSILNAVFGTNFVTTGRTDIAAIYTPDVLRVDTTTGPVPLIGQGGNRLSGLGGDTTGGKWSGWPNGRRLGDDVVDILFTAMASGPAYSSIFLLGDNVNHNDMTYNFVFPYAATPQNDHGNSACVAPGTL